MPPRAQWFQNRAETDRLVQVLAVGGTAVVESADQAWAGGVLAGMGGVGKTQLAAHYARTAWQAGELDVLVWITASTRTAVVTGYGQAGVELLGADPGDPETAAREFLAWLEPKPQQRPCRWLVVLDDIADPADVRGLWPPVSEYGCTVATTRRKDAALTSGRRLLEVGLFTPAQALAYLTSALAGHGRTAPDHELAALAEDVGRLPLALSQAAAYLIDTGISSCAFRALLADRSQTLADAAPDALPDDQTHTVAAAWSLSLDRADTLRPVGLSRPVLQLAAFLNPNDIPTIVLTSPPALAHLTDRQAAASRPVTAGQVELALGALRRLSLIEHAPSSPHQAVHVHQLIQQAVRDTLDPDQHHHLVRTAADALAAVWPDVEHDTALAQILRTNVSALADRAQGSLWSSGCHPVLIRCGDSLVDAGLVADALAYWQMRCTEANTYLPSGHSDVLIVRSHLADTRGHAGYRHDAAVAFEELLTDALRVWDIDHPEVLAMRHNLAHWRGHAGSPRRAVSDLESLLRDYAAGPDPVHGDVLVIRNSLAMWYGEAGDAARAESAFKGLLVDCTEALGPDHPDVLKVRGNLARFRGEAGDAAGAAVALEELLGAREQRLGRDHNDVLITRHNLATMRGRAGDAARAASDFAELLEDRLRILGPDHPHILANRTALAYWRALAGAGSPNPG